MIQLLHFFFGHRWSEWKWDVVNKGYYDEERWKERTCFCGAVQVEEE